MTHVLSKSSGRVALLAAAAAMTCAPGAQAGVASWFGFEGGSNIINCTLGECFRPPDTMGAVGTTQFVETANGYVRVYDKMTGVVQTSSNMANFWTLAGLPGGAGGDQRVLFDHYTNRWLLIGFGSIGNKLNIAISDTANAAGIWKSTQIVGASLATPMLGTLDYPTLGMDDKAVYIGTNNFNPGYTGSGLFVIPKASLTAAAPSTANMTAFTSVARGNTPQVAVNWQGNPTNTASLMADSNTGDNQVFYQITGVNGPGAVRTAKVEIAGSGYTVAGAARQPDGSQYVDTLSPRITGNVMQVNGKLYSAITVDDGTLHAAVRWSVNNATTGAVIETGLISGGGYDYFQGSVAVNEFGQAVIGFNRSGFQTADANGDGKPDGNISFMARTFNTDAGGGLDQSGADVLLKVSGISDYHCSTRVAPDPACRQRWGDYSAVSLDPTNHQRFYAIGEYASEWTNLPAPFNVQRAIWNTYVASITVAAPVPEPETYVLMLAGLVAIGSLARRRRIG